MMGYEVTTDTKNYFNREEELWEARIKLLRISDGTMISITDRNRVKRL
ncbi:hypothetical protein DOY81_007828 [Sarcophaga bullata]|nr:hypothetical protein DOY81_007828 [Sarcophaga bullata]